MTLPPLKHVEGGYDIGPALPAIAKVTPTQGGMPVQSEAGIISVPEGCGALPSKTEAGIISVQGAEDPVGVAHARAQAQHPSKGQSSTHPTLRQPPTTLAHETRSNCTRP